MKALRFARAALPLLALACARPGRPISPRAPDERPTAAAPVTVRVTNHNWLLVEVRVLMDDHSIRLGQVETARTATFTLPPRATAATELRLAAYPLGSADKFTSGPIMVGPGAVIELEIENMLPLSSVSVGDDGPPERTWPLTSAPR
jgi:hypothetical protein